MSAEKGKGTQQLGEAWDSVKMKKKKHGVNLKQWGRESQLISLKWKKKGKGENKEKLAEKTSLSSLLENIFSYYSSLWT